jgi:phosphohistidine phosphatase
MTTDESGQSERNTRQLILMRHAKSDWGDHSLSDHERPLNGRGRRDSPRMAQWLSEIDMVPDVVLSSSSVRTRETVALMVEQWSVEPVLSFSDNLYHSSAESILAVIRSDACDARRLMVVAHNPGMAHLVSSLSNRLIEMPTAAIAIFQLQLTDWTHLGPGTPIELIQHMRPKAL